ncbi:MAG: hypothetical protein K8J08_07010 [Thermoanaerobaculia bacterium]|nr:hypothetical protein [Thermoanaerobaculia bacterium]
MAQTTDSILDAPPSRTGVLPDSTIAGAIRAGCGTTHPFETYQPTGRRYEVTGPLFLEEGRESVPRGVILPPYLRVFLYGRSRGCKRATVDEARELAGPEVWVVLWRHEDPPNPPGQQRTSLDQRILRPTEVRWRSEGRWHEATETRTRDRWIHNWYGQEWIERESLVAVFPTLKHNGALHADYKVEEDGRSYLTDSEIFSLTVLPKKWWLAAHGQAEE